MINSVKCFVKSINIPQPNSLLSMDWRIDSVVEIKSMGSGTFFSETKLSEVDKVF